MTRPTHTGRKNQDFWVDGHFVSAYSAADAINEARYLYDYEPQMVRSWTDADQVILDDTEGQL